MLTVALTMPYRENDPKAGEEAENRAALERLAAVGLAKKTQLAADRQSEQLAARTRATSTQFRKRAWASPRKLRFTGFWLAACGFVAFGAALVTLVTSRDLAEAIAYGIVAFILANVSAITAIPIMILYAIHAAIWRRRDATTFVAWNTSLPFPFARFVETLSLDHSLNDVRVVVRFVRDVPEASVLDGLVGNLAMPDHVKVVRGERACAFFASSLSDGEEPPNDVAAFVRELVAKVLLPLHAVHEIERTALDEGDSRASWDFGDEHDKLVALLGQ
jgi:hypothetical protein